MDDYDKYWYDTLGNSTVTFEKAGKKFTFDCSKIWGFQYHYKLFRSGKDGTPPLRIISAGKIVYYENGLAHLEMLKNDSENGNFSKGFYCYVSVNLLGKTVAMPPELSNELYKEVEKFKKENKQYKKLFECIESDYNYPKISECIKKFEKGK